MMLVELSRTCPRPHSEAKHVAQVVFMLTWATLPPIYFFLLCLSLVHLKVNDVYAQSHKLHLDSCTRLRVTTAI